MANHRADLAGQRFGKLIAIAQSHRVNGRWHWRLRCDCGNETTRSAGRLRTAAREGRNSSCGCTHHLRTHGLSKPLKHLRWVWSSMKARCYNEGSKDFKNYGGRGIAVCDDWHSFEAFAEWAVSTGYRRGLTIERVDVDAGYHPDNCTWMPNPRQARNRTNTHWFTHNGKTMDIRGWSEESGVPYFTLRSRLLNYQWPIGRAIAEPVRGGHDPAA